jgi:hypothetical protein
MKTSKMENSTPSEFSFQLLVPTKALEGGFTNSFFRRNCMVLVAGRMQHLIVAVGTVSTALFASCGTAKNSRSSKVEKPTQGDVSVEVKLSAKEELMGLALVGGAAYTAEIVGCKSGLSFPLLDNNSPNVRVLNADRGCVFELRSFSLEGESFDLAGKSFASGNIFQVQGSLGSNLEFTVISNLEDPIDGDQLVKIIYGVVQEGGRQAVDASVNAGIQIEGALPIGLEIKHVSLQVDAQDGAGLLSFVLECDVALENGECMGIAPNSLKAQIAKDSYGGSLSLQQCFALAQSGSSLSAVPAGDAVAPNGGGSTAQLKGPAPLFGPGNNQMILAIAGSEDSCKYFELEILRP